MNILKKNFVFAGFNEAEMSSLHYYGINDDYRQRVHYLDSISEARGYQGYLLVINNKENIPIIELDKKYRKIFNKYTHVVIYNKNYQIDHIKWTNINTFGDKDYDYLESFSFLWDDYREESYGNPEVIVKGFNKNKKEQIDILNNYLKNFKTIKTSQIEKDLNMNPRSIQRYMKDINNMYHNIGYDYTSNEWYIL